jgi:hypothetical protein
LYTKRKWDGGGHGQDDRDQRPFSPAHLATAWPQTLSGASVQIFQRPAFAARLKDIVGLYVDPPDRAVILSIDEKSQIQALDRTQSTLPMKEGARRHHMTHDDKRHGTITVFAALDVLEGKETWSLHQH